ncbi:Uma2 family endonuclease [Merismopedia glauca]|uniref:Putative restriction endonuclease domain-containing protein n=1 Tax=Merismopedia glauca CCAP 1448/3 TaxID=1296344 RepID=A0A2T1BYC9_9CYAN|nr:Uma2 family endonuclease [Merismopedia glauca]PSB01002.1 hypothetical protein C7B64_20620 [Merismopedia glauca CCAP 1448/3]
MQATQQEYYTPEEYLKLEEAADYKSEYIEGQIITMAGGSTNHNRIAGNCYAIVNFALRQQNYEAFIGDVRLWIPKKRIFTYPDVMVIAGEPEYFNDRTDTILNPQIIVEVLSPSTQGYDCEAKFEAYRTIESFQEYLLVDQTRIHVEHFSKTGKKQWMLREYDAEDTAIALASLNLSISLSDLYSRVKLEDIEENQPQS